MAEAVSVRRAWHERQSKEGRKSFDRIQRMQTKAFIAARAAEIKLALGT